MSKAKKIIGALIEGGAEIVKDSARQLSDTVSPVKMVEQALGTPQSGKEDEFSKYLKNLGGELTPAEMEKKRQEFAEKQAGEMDQATQVIKAALPDHLKPPSGPPEASVFEKMKQEEEHKKAMQVEAQKKQKGAIAAPAGKKTGVLGKRKKPASSDFETGKNKKIG